MELNNIIICVFAKEYKSGSRTSTTDFKKNWCFLYFYWKFLYREFDFLRISLDSDVHEYNRLTALCSTHIEAQVGLRGLQVLYGQVHQGIPQRYLHRGMALSLDGRRLSCPRTCYLRLIRSNTHRYLHRLSRYLSP